MSLLRDLYHQKRNPPPDLSPDLKGRNVLITGANTGLGLEVAVKCVGLGAEQVILGVRDLSKGHNAKQIIEQRTGRNDCVLVWELDMLDYDSVKAFAKKANELHRLDIAILNAGIYPVKYELSKYGWEKSLQINTLSTVLLALLLLPKLRQTDQSMLEIIISTNILHETQLKGDEDGHKILETYNSPQNFTLYQYNFSKLFLEYAKPELIRIAAKTSSDIETPRPYIVSLCPGAVQTDLQRSFAEVWYTRIAVTLTSFIKRPVEHGARVYVNAIAAGEKAHRTFWRQNAPETEEPPLAKGEEGRARQKKVWSEIVAALEKDVPEVRELL